MSHYTDIGDDIDWSTSKDKGPFVITSNTDIFTIPTPSEIVVHFKDGNKYEFDNINDLINVMTKLQEIEKYVKL